MDTQNAERITAHAIDGRSAMLTGLRLVAADVAANWRASDYPGDMQRHREQFRHAHTHAMKALGKIAAVIDHQDHDRLTDHEGRAALAELPKLLADLVRCAAKMAEGAPVPVDFADACVARADQLAARWSSIRSARAAE